MCGIVGTVGFDDRVLAGRMAQAIRHRGPDGAGVFSEGPANLGMVRLSIIDLAGGHQPMTDERRRFQLVFNGEIYNYQTLRAGLEKRGHHLTTQSDTEVIVHLYEESGERCVEELNGDFAFAVWDTVEKRLFLARDRLGVKPLYYWHQGSRFAFASELKALLCLPEVSKELDVEALDTYLALAYIPAPQSIIRQIKKLPAGCWLMFHDGLVQIQRYWRLPQPQNSRRSLREDRDEILARLKEAVRLRLMSDVPLGAFLSGGLDSSCIVGFMSQYVTQPVRTFSIGFEQPYGSYNELPFARMAARAFHTDHHEYVVNPDAAALLPQVAWHMDEPFADPTALVTFLISREAKRTVTVALTGIGGDEVFGGYPRYLGAWASVSYARLPRLVRLGIAKAASVLPESTASRDLAGWGKRFTQGGLDPPDQRYVSWVSSLSPALKDALYTAALKASASSAPYRAMLGGPTESYLDRVNAFDVQHYLPDDLLVMGDKMSMAHGLEVRVPFCDHHVVEFAAAIPLRARMAGFRLKSLLKDAVKGLLPPELLRRRKQGFMVPVGDWLRHELDPVCRDLFSPARVRRRGWFKPEAPMQLLDRHQRGEANLTQQVYALLMLELWCQQYLDG